MTGSFERRTVPAGANTLRYRQFSLPSVVLSVTSWMQSGAKRSAGRIPDQGITGCGGRHRVAPTGGAA